MNKTDMQMKYWSNMLNEAMDDKTLNERRMNGPAAAAKGGVDEIALMREQLNNGVVEFEFTKADGTLRHAVGTTSEAVVPVAERRQLDPNYDANVESYMHRQGYIIWFWDLEKNEVRCFNTNRYERTINAENFNRRANGVDRVGNIFIHRDIDPAVQLDDDLLVEIEHDIENEFGGNGNDNIRWDEAVPGAIAVNVHGFEMDVGPNREPVLRMQFTKRGNDDDPPYQLCVNEIRKYIKETYNVDIKRVEVKGAIAY